MDINFNKSACCRCQNKYQDDDTYPLSVFELRAKCCRLKKQHGISLIVVDYIQLLRAGDNTGNREKEVLKSQCLLI